MYDLIIGWFDGGESTVHAFSQEDLLELVKHFLNAPLCLNIKIIKVN